MHEKSIKLLNQGLADEMWAVHQYMYFHFHCDDQGFDLLAELFKRTAISEMQHVEQFGERILFLGGTVEMKASHEVEPIHDVRGMLKKALEMERNAVKDYNDFANQCSKNADAASRQIFEHLVEDEEGHADMFEVELKHLDQFGDQYLALQSLERTKNMAGGGPA
ncbi:MAG: bacterioferritin [Gemmatimonadota bacterium]|jgi:bacterioferritin